ncbi:uncharacterized protein [Amphiura filiformis]|uniref:uncharacterized protein n=1 Tax=Amphiura filiformis TaxID=82378 RepID=UPI003B225A49
MEIAVKFAGMTFLLTCCVCFQTCAVNVDSQTLSAWHLVFKAVAGVAEPDPYELWISDAPLNEYVPKAQQLTNEFSGHYKSKLVGLWDQLDVVEVKVSLIKNGVVVKEILFDGTGSDHVSWFSTSKILASPWSDLDSATNTLLCSVEGLYHENVAIRRFYIASNHNSCANDAGWLAMGTDYWAGCSWDRPAGIAHPFFVYSDQTTASTWESDPVNYADVFAISIKTPLRMPAGPSIMHSNSRFTSTGNLVLSYQGLSFAQCIIQCKLDTTCSSFNHHTESMTCELNTVRYYEGILEEQQGWDFYSVNRNPGGKCDENPCQNNGCCQISSNPLGFRCLCQPPYYGTNCQL